MPHAEFADQIDTRLQGEGHTAFQYRGLIASVEIRTLVCFDANAVADSGSQQGLIRHLTVTSMGGRVIGTHLCVKASPYPALSITFRAAISTAAAVLFSTSAESEAVCAAKTTSHTFNFSCMLALSPSCLCVTAGRSEKGGKKDRHMSLE